MIKGALRLLHADKLKVIKVIYDYLCLVDAELRFSLTKIISQRQENIY